MRDDLLSEIRRIPIIDVHSHMNRDQIAAKGLSSVILYHMIRYPLRSAGADPNVIWPGKGREVDDRTQQAEWAKFFPAIANTAFARKLGAMLAELYDFHDPISADSLPRLQEKFDRANADPDWGMEVLDRAGVVRILSAHADVKPIEPGDRRDIFRFTLEPPIFSANNEFTDPANRLERVDHYLGLEAKTFDDLVEAHRARLAKLDFGDRRVLVGWISAMGDVSTVNDRSVKATIERLRRGEPITPNDQAVYEGALIRALCSVLGEFTDTYQFVYGTQFLTAPDPATHPVTRANPAFATSFARLLGEFPDIHFNLLSGVENDEVAWCSLGQGYANLSFGGYWWSGFYPTAMHHGWHRRLDMVPINRLCGFFSDGYCADWVFARVRQTQRVLANVLAEKIERGEFTFDQALDAARNILFETPRQLFLPHESI